MSKEEQQSEANGTKALVELIGVSEEQAARMWRALTRDEKLAVLTSYAMAKLFEDMDKELQNV